MEDEMKRLTPEQRAAVERVIARARMQSGCQREGLPDGEAYAYQGGGGIHWGVNGGEHGWCIARGKVPE